MYLDKVPTRIDLCAVDFFFDVKISVELDRHDQSLDSHHRPLAVEVVLVEPVAVDVNTLNLLGLTAPVEEGATTTTVLRSVGKRDDCKEKCPMKKTTLKSFSVQTPKITTLTPETNRPF